MDNPLHRFSWLENQIDFKLHQWTPMEANGLQMIQYFLSPPSESFGSNKQNLIQM